MRIPLVPHRTPPPKTPVEAARQAALETGRISADAVARNARRDPAKIPVLDPERVFQTPEALRAADRDGPQYVRALTDSLVKKALEGEIRLPGDDLSIYQVADRLVAELEQPERAAARTAAMHKRVDGEIAKLRAGLSNRHRATPNSSGGTGKKPGDPSSPPAQATSPFVLGPDGKPRPLSGLHHTAAPSEDREPSHLAAAFPMALPAAVPALSAEAVWAAGGAAAAPSIAAALALGIPASVIANHLLNPVAKDPSPGPSIASEFYPEGHLNRELPTRQPDGISALEGLDDLARLIWGRFEQGIDEDGFGFDMFDVPVDSEETQAAEDVGGTSAPVTSGDRGDLVNERRLDQSGSDALSMDVAEQLKPNPGISFPEISGWNILGDPVLDESEFPPLVLLRIAHEPENPILYTPEIPVRIQDLILEMYGSRGGPDTLGWLRAIRDGVLDIGQELDLNVEHVGGSEDHLTGQDRPERVVPEVDPVTNEPIHATRNSVRADLSFRCTNADGVVTRIDIQTTDNLRDGRMTSKGIRQCPQITR